MIHIKSSIISSLEYLPLTSRETSHEDRTDTWPQYMRRLSKQYSLPDPLEILEKNLSHPKVWTDLVKKNGCILLGRQK